MTNFIELTNSNDSKTKMLLNLAWIERISPNDQNSGTNIYFTTLHYGGSMNITVTESYEEIKKALLK